MKLIHAAGFSQADKEQFRVIIFANMLQSLKAIIIAMDEYELSFSNEENEVDKADALQIGCFDAM